MKKSCISFLVCIIIILSAVGLIIPIKQTNVEYLRIHIRADDNSQQAQEVKLLVRDKVVEYLTPIIAELDTKQKAQRNLVFVTVFNIYQFILFFPIPFIDSDRGFFNTLLIIIQLIYSLANALLLFKCYAMICPEGQEDMPQKRSKFAFVNKMRDIRDAKEQKAIEEMKNYYEDKLKAKNSKKKKKKK